MDYRIQQAASQIQDSRDLSFVCFVCFDAMSTGQGSATSFQFSKAFLDEWLNR